MADSGDQDNEIYKWREKEGEDKRVTFRAEILQPVNFEPMQISEMQIECLQLLMQGLRRNGLPHSAADSKYSVQDRGRGVY